MIRRTKQDAGRVPSIELQLVLRRKLNANSFMCKDWDSLTAGSGGTLFAFAHRGGALSASYCFFLKEGSLQGSWRGTCAKSFLRPSLPQRTT